MKRKSGMMKKFENKNWNDARNEKKINKQVKNFSERLTNIMGHVKNRQAGAEDKAEELDHTVEVNDELKNT